jgi:hypothetical protein
MQLRERAVLQEAAGKRVSVVEGDRGERLVLKRYPGPTRAARLERAFLRAAASRPLDSLEVPRVVADGDDFLLTGFVEREHQTRDTILERAWTAGDVRLWVRGLLEFQALPLPARLFSFRQRVLGWLYPVFRAAALWRDLPRRGVAAGLVARYVFARPFFRNVATHYDLQTHNYAFRIGARKMSLLDFEFSYCRGDPLFDLLYFVTIPVARLEEWTIQRDLVREFLAQWKGSRAGLRTRVRLILLVCNAGRRRALDAEEYRDNVALLSDQARFRRWWQSLG